MALSLKAAITATQTTFDVTGSDALSPGDLKTVGSETLEIRTANQATVNYGEAAYWRVNANRGSLGTTKAAHAAGAAVTTTSIGGGGSVTPAAFVEPTTATPEALAQALIDADLMESS